MNFFEGDGGETQNKQSKPCIFLILYAIQQSIYLHKKISTTRLGVFFRSNHNPLITMVFFHNNEVCQ